MKWKMSTRSFVAGIMAMILATAGIVTGDVYAQEQLTGGTASQGAAVSETDQIKTAVQAAEEIKEAAQEAEVVEVELSKAEKQEIAEAREEVVADLKGEDILDMDQQQVDELMAEAIENNYDDVTKDMEEVKEQASEDGDVQVTTDMPDKTYQVEKGVSVTFSDDSVALNTLEEGPEMNEPQGMSVLSRALAFVAEPCYAASGSKSKIVSNSTTFYDKITKRKTFRVFLEVKFTYNKSKKTCTCSTLSHYAKKYNLETLFSQVYDKEYSVDKDSKGSRTCRQSAYISIGFQYQGNGMVFEESYASAAISCNYKGKVKYYNKKA